MEQSAVDAVVSVQFDDVVDSVRRIEAFIDCRNDQSFDLLAGSFKRIRNIIKDNLDVTVNPDLFTEKAEGLLHQLCRELEERGGKFLAAGDYRGYLGEMMRLKEPVDRFFDDVMVMADDQALKTNRLNLLTAVNRLILEVGDISRMHTG
jgi:glycyl-tRNA synthetase beta chain